MILNTTSGTTPDARLTEPGRRFREAYAEHRAREGREELAAIDPQRLPYVTSGKWAREWAVRARSFECFRRRVWRPMAHSAAPAPLRVLDLGAGNGWLSYRVRKAGGRVLAVDLRTDRVDGLGAADRYRPFLHAMFGRVAAAFDRLPLDGRNFDVAIFNASLHYAVDLRRAFREVSRVVRGGGRIVIMDSPFYRTESDGAAMVREKRRAGTLQFGDLADDLLRVASVEFLTAARLESASASLGLRWKRHRVWYPMWYELRPFHARLRGGRRPSRFDLWETVVP